MVDQTILEISNTVRDLADLIDDIDTDCTDAEIQTWSGITQDQHNKVTKSILDFGGVEGDNPPRLSDKFTTLAEAKAAYPTVANKITTLNLYVNDVAALHSEAKGNSLKVPEGVWRFTSPYTIGEGTFLYGRGAKCIFDKAETRRTGGSTGNVRDAEQYTLYYKYDSDTQIKVEVNGIQVPWVWWSQNVISVAAVANTTSNDIISYYVENGYIFLSDTPECIVGVLVDIATGTKLTPTLENGVNIPTAGNLVRIGSRAGGNITTGGNSVYLGARAGASFTTTGNNVAIGFQAHQRGTGSSNVVIGSVAMEWNYSGSDNTAIGSGAASSLYTGDSNTVLGSGAFKAIDGNNNAVYGANAVTGIGYGRTINSLTVLGAQAGRYHWGSSNTFVGYAAGRSNTNNGMNTNNGSQNAALGWQALSNISSGSNNIGLGNLALANITTQNGNTAVGCEAARYATGMEQVVIGLTALKNSTGSRNTVVGTRSQTASTTGSENTSLGFETLVNTVEGSQNTALGMWAGRNITTGNANTIIGSRAAYNETTGTNNVVIGASASTIAVECSNSTVIGTLANRLLIDGTTAPTSLSNFTCLGYQASISASNQIQLGNPSTTPYAYQALQLRSDSRDKADQKELADIYSEFILGLTPKSWRWDRRDAYVLELFPVPDAPEQPTYVNLPTEPDKDEDTDEESEIYLQAVADYKEALLATQTANNKIKAEYDAKYAKYQAIMSKRDKKVKAWWSKPTKDGSHKQTREHLGFIAQEVKELADKLGIDFAGLQHHQVKDGTDTYTLGYEEFISPIVYTLQKLNSRMNDIESRLAKLES